MTEIASAPPLGAALRDSGPAAGATPDPVAIISADIGRLKASGRMSAAQADAALAELNGAAPIAVPSVAAPAAGTPEAALEQGSTLSADQMAAVHADLKRLVAAGRMTQAQADAALKDAGVTPAAAGTPEAAALSPAAAEIDAAFPPAKPGEFTMPPLVEADDKFATDSEEAKTIADRAELARGWLAEAKLPAETGSYIAKEIATVNVLTKPMTDAQFEVWQRGEVAKLGKLWGDRAGEKIELAKRLVHELEARRPGIMQALNNSGAGGSANVIAQLAEHAERRLARHG